ncbi:MAG: SsrA-binding protein SmpB [Planctomycetes bacterium]|nr:SsrA-binding protein SmpB [Planctomycetota bacterium]MCB9910461.1 SsrA-binding protein SmpB [Planctomycetota bacterium]MCB9912587.1 SsrA-binding protein SmpB [Planctomycetota bacterium]HPF15089.1 SsrA-binding protein SmpB [Planctomycetota bacterium]
MAATNKKGSGKPQERRSVARNRRARHDFHIVSELECGIALLGTEVKSLRGGQCSLQEAFVRIDDGELWLMRAHIPEYVFGNAMNHEPLRQRKLLAHRSEIRKWEKLLKERGTTAVPLEVYFQGSKVKVLVALVTGKKQHDKRAAVKERQDKREIDRAFARRDR